MKTYIGIDNRVSGTIAIIDANKDALFYEMPVFSQQNYTKKKGNITRVDTNELLHSILGSIHHSEVAMVGIERPMVNPKRWVASCSALRAMEATLIVLEYLGFPYMFLDSKEWQKMLLPHGVKGTPALKHASMDRGCQLYPQHRELITKHKDADGLLMAEYLRRMRL